MSRSVRKIQLPKDFAEKLLDCQIEHKLSDRPSQQILKKLAQMYAMGVEYYQSIRSHKYLYFQLKMQQLFTVANTLTPQNQEKDANTQSPLKKKLRSIHQQQKIQALQIKQKQQKLLQQMASTTSQNATATTVKKLINENDAKNKQINAKLNQQILNQDQRLKQKIKKRKSRLLFSKSFSSSGMGQNDTQDTLFADNLGDVVQEVQTKPIQANFGNVIQENQSDEDQQIKKTNSKNQIKLFSALEN